MAAQEDLSQSMSNADSPIVVSGPPRSGTTLFMAYLDGHSDGFWLPDEGFFFEHLELMGADRQDLLIEAATADLEACIEGLRDRSIMPMLHRPIVDFPSLDLGWSDQRFRSALKLDDVSDLRTLWTRLVDAYRAGLNAQGGFRTIVKAADFGRSVFGALRYFPEARGIVVVRDPIEMLNSLKRYRERGGARRLTWPTLAQTIREMNELARSVDTLSEAESERLTVVRYEDLMANPESVMRRVGERVGLTWQPTLAVPTMLGRPWAGNSSFAEQAGTDAVPENRPVTLKPWERDLANKHLDGFRQTFGYSH